MRFEETHRTLIQMIMHAGIMSDSDMQEKVAVIFNHSNSAAFYVGMMNSRLEPIGMMIKSANCEHTGQKYWALMSTTLDNVTRFQSQFSQGQLELLRKVFQHIIMSTEGSASSMECLNTPLENHLTKEAREEFLKDMVRRMWLENKEGYFFMGVRSIIELMPYFRATYEDGFNICPLCKLGVFHGQRCEQCQVVSHLYCLAHYARIQKPLKCSNCKGVLPTDNLPEVPDPTLNHEDSFGGASETPRQKRTKKSRR